MSALESERYLPDYVRSDLGELRETHLNAVTGDLNLGILFGGRAWARPLSIWIGLITNATVATRIPLLQILNGDGTVVANIAAINGQAAGANSTYSWVNGISFAYGPLNAGQLMPFPNIVLPSGWRINILNQSGNAGDTFGPLQMVYEALPTGPPRVPIAVAPLAKPLLLT